MVGLKAMVLEQSDNLRTEGTAITLSSNAFLVLENLDVADQFRSTYLNIARYICMGPFLTTL
jgi:2-polyprenyl-6-methoxyphenol hydroxylase-like FAD-dependent oxidoreductase